MRFHKGFDLTDTLNAVVQYEAHMYIYCITIQAGSKKGFECNIDYTRIEKQFMRLEVCDPRFCNLGFWAAAITKIKTIIVLNTKIPSGALKKLSERFHNRSQGRSIYAP